MSAISEMVDRFCPNGVEYKTLGEVGVCFYRGNGILRTQVTNTGVPCVRYGEIYTAYGPWFDVCVSHTKVEYVGSPQYFEHGDILFSITGEKVDEIGKSTAYVGDDRCLAGGDIVVMKHRQDPKYLSYALSTATAQRQKSKGKVKSKVVHSSIPELKKVVIPVPPLPVQQEIVRRLDAMADLIAELERELAARKKQYEWAREETFRRLEAAGVEKRKLGEICNVLRGKRLTQSMLSEDNRYPVYHGGLEPLGKYSEYNREADTVMVVNVGASAGTVGYSPCKFWSSDGCFSISKNNEMISKFLYYALKGEQNFLISRVRIAGIPTLDAGDLLKVEIPIPPLPVQQEIVGRLDNMKDLAVAIEKEIALRKQQYEFYRDEMLTFRRAG